VLETLEDRKVLAAGPVAVYPLPNEPRATTDSEIRAQYDADVDPASASAQSLAVHADRTGWLLAPPSDVRVSGDTVTLTPNEPFFPGDMVQVTATEKIASLGDEAFSPFVWQFRTKVSKGIGVFGRTGQSLGDRLIMSVALGDLDHDGDLDAFLATNVENMVWFNDGRGTFADSGQRLGELTTFSVALGDLDGDGDLDAMAGNGGIWLNADVPTDVSIAITNGQSMAAPGQLLVYTVTVTNHGPGDIVDANVKVTLPPQMSGASWICTPTGGSWCGFGGMGDIADRVSLLAGDTATYTVTGRLSPLANEPVISKATVTAAGDQGDITAVNNVDVDTDLVLSVSVNPEVNSHAVPRDTNISGDFGQEIAPESVSVETFVIHGSQSAQLVSPANEIRVEGSTVTLSPGQPFHAGELVQVSATPRIAPVAADGAIAPFVWQFRTDVARASGLFTISGPSLGLFSSGLSNALGDLDGDGDLDAFLGNFVNGDQNMPNGVWLNDGQGRLEDSGQSLGESPTNAVALGDLDGDGDLDAFVANGGGREPAADEVWINDGKAQFSDSGQRLGKSGSRAVALGDLDGDGDLDAFVGNIEEADTVWLNDGQGRFRDAAQQFPDSSTISVALADLDMDGDLDAFLGNANNEVWLNDGRGRFQHSAQRLQDWSGFVALGDVDGDNAVDAVFLNPGREGQVWLNTGAGRFRDSGVRLETGFSIALGDIDGDADLDALIGHLRGGSYSSRFWVNDGTGTFFAGQGLPQAHGISVSMGDLDRDGDLDALLTYGSSQVWLNEAATGDTDGDGRFDQADIMRALRAGKYLTGSAAGWSEGDWNLDGVFDQLDIVIALQSGSYLPSN
jgi:uncharacterized repeat protein (TIGR01451 family)